jgi:antitoxin ParD1/3/4
MALVFLRAGEKLPVWVEFPKLALLRRTYDLSGTLPGVLDTCSISWQWIDNICQHPKMEKKGGVAMETMNIALPDSMKHFVQERVAEGGYSSVSEYVRELIRTDQKRKAEERIDALLLEGLGSGEPVRVTNEYWDEKKRKLTERLGKAIGPQ